MNDMQRMLADSIDRFTANEYDFDTRQRNATSQTGYSKRTWATFAELGWTAVPFADEDGGFGGGAVDVMVVMERFGKALVVEPYLANVILAGGVLKRSGSPTQRRDWLEPLIGGTLHASFGFVEPQAGYELNDVQSTAVRDGNDWILEGHKAYVLNAASADLIIVGCRSAGGRSDDSGISLFAIPAGTNGLGIQPYETVDGGRAADVFLDAVRVGDDNRIGNPDEGFDTLSATVDDAAFAVCAEALGILQVVTKKTIEYTKNRTQFGVPIGSFQALQHRMVDMYTAVEQTRSLLLWAAMADADNRPKAVSAVKYQVGNIGQRIAEESVQLHGGMGMTWELDIAHYFKRLTSINRQFGSGDWHLSRLARPDQSDGGAGLL